MGGSWRLECSESTGLQAGQQTRLHKLQPNAYCWYKVLVRVLKRKSCSEVLGCDA